MGLDLVDQKGHFGEGGKQVLQVLSAAVHFSDPGKTGNLATPVVRLPELSSLERS